MVPSETEQFHRLIKRRNLLFTFLLCARKGNVDCEYMPRWSASIVGITYNILYTILRLYYYIILYEIYECKKKKNLLTCDCRHRRR